MTALIWCPFPDRQTARTIANTLLDEKLIGCANIIGDIEAIFQWNEERGNAIEVGVLFKCNAEILDRVVERLGQLHPYDTPAVLGWKCDSANSAAQDWLGRNWGEG